jgi:hypothetical protein
MIMATTGSRTMSARSPAGRAASRERDVVGDLVRGLERPGERAEESLGRDVNGVRERARSCPTAYWRRS